LSHKSCNIVTCLRKSGLEGRIALVPDWLKVGSWIAPWVVDDCVLAVSVRARIVSAAFVIVTLSVNNASNTTSVLVANSEPLSLLSRSEGVEVLGDESGVVGARLDLVSASAGLSVCGRSGNVNCASVLVIAQLDVLADSVLLPAEVDSARVVVVTVCVVLAAWSALANIGTIGSRSAIAASVGVWVCAISSELALVWCARSSLAESSKGSLWAVRVLSASASRLELDLASSELLVAGCLVAGVEVLGERASIGQAIRVGAAATRSWASGVVWNILVHAVSSCEVARVCSACLSVVAVDVGVLADINSKTVLDTLSSVAFVLWLAVLLASWAVGGIVWNNLATLVRNITNCGLAVVCKLEGNCEVLAVLILCARSRAVWEFWDISALALSSCGVASVDSADLSVVAVDWSVLASNLSVVVSSASLQSLAVLWWTVACWRNTSCSVERRALADRSSLRNGTLCSVARCVWLAIKDLADWRRWASSLVSGWLSLASSSGWVEDEGSALQFSGGSNCQSVTASLVLALATSDELVVASSSGCIASVESASNSVVARRRVLAGISIVGLNTSCHIARSVWSASLLALAQLGVGDWSLLASSSGWVEDKRQALLRESLECCQSVTASLVLALAVLSLLVNTLSGVDVARVDGASDSIVASLGKVLADHTRISGDTFCNVTWSSSDAISKVADWRRSAKTSDNWNDLASLSGWVVDCLLAVACKVLVCDLSLAAVGVLALASWDLSVNALSSCEVARIFSASNSVVAVDWVVVANVSLVSLDAR